MLFAGRIRMRNTRVKYCAWFSYGFRAHLESNHAIGRTQKVDAEKNDQGVGRAEPNNDPFCPEPVGRIKLSLNPFEMFA